VITLTIAIIKKPSIRVIICQAIQPIHYLTSAEEITGPRKHSTNIFKYQFIKEFVFDR
jgi:hypothetical protein